MKKTILALLILLTAALVFTGCKKDAEIPPLEGTWIGSVNVPEVTGGGITIPAYTMEYTKIDITGNTYKQYSPTGISYFAIVAWSADQSQPKPATVWKSLPDEEGTVTVSGNTITFTNGDGDEMVCTRSKNGKSITFTNPAYDPEDADSYESITFKKK